MFKSTTFSATPAFVAEGLYMYVFHAYIVYGLARVTNKRYIIFAELSTALRRYTP